MDWVPTLDADPGRPVYQRLIDAIAADIGSGRLLRGQQLPTHRALARTLGIDVTTVTRAYSEARRRGLTEARVGQGTFVADSQLRPPHATAPGIAFDLSMNLPPQPMEADLERRIAVGLTAIQREFGFSAYLNYQQTGGTPEECEIAATWLRTRFPAALGERVVIMPGTQAALFSIMIADLKPGDVVLTDTLTYPGIKAAAAYTGVTLIGVAADHHGMTPEALQAACQKHAPRAVYLIPTIHNPTTVTMPQSRREALAEVIAAHRLLCLEDDAYGPLVPDVKPLATLIPAQTYCATSLSKCIAPGLRVSFLQTPDTAAVERVTAALRATLQMPVPLMRALATRWLGDGTADTVITAIRNEAAARQKLAAKALAGHRVGAHPMGHHIWLPLPPAWSRMEFTGHLQRQGLAIVTSETFSVDEEPGTPAPAHAIRVSLGAARNQSELVRALDVLATALKLPGATARIV